MIKSSRLVLYLILAFLTVGIFFLFQKKSPSKAHFADNVVTNTNLYLTLSDSVEKFIDTAFYAEYRIGKGDFVFYYLRNDSIADFFEVKSSSQKKVFDQLYSLGVQKIWKYNSENFYRYVLYIDRITRPQLLILSGTANSFSVPINSKINGATIVNSTKDLGNDNITILYKVSSRCWYYCPSKD